MSWSTYLIWTSGIYSLYYALTISWDIFRAGQGPKEEGWSGELQVAEDVAPVKVGAPAVQYGSAKAAANPVIASGGVILKDLFNLAKTDAVEYTRAVSYG